MRCSTALVTAFACLQALTTNDSIVMEVVTAVKPIFVRLHVFRYAVLPSVLQQPYVISDAKGSRCDLHFCCAITCSAGVK